MPRQLVGLAELVLGRSMRCIWTLSSLVDFYGPYLKTIWPPTSASKVVFLPTPKIFYIFIYIYVLGGTYMYFARGKRHRMMLLSQFN